MGMSALSDMHARSPQASGIHIRQSMSAHVITNMLHSGTLRICLNLVGISSLHSYILKDRILIVIVGFYYDFGIMFCTL